MRLAPVDLAEAKRFVADHHRHNLPPLSWKFGVALQSDDGERLGVALAGRPIARALDGKHVIEITRVCTLGARNANSMLYAACLRAARALGYDVAYTYTLESESGASLRAVGFELDAVLPDDRSWQARSGVRPRYEENLFGERLSPAGTKLRWRCAHGLPAGVERPFQRGEARCGHRASLTEEADARLVAP